MYTSKQSDHRNEPGIITRTMEDDAKYEAIRSERRRDQSSDYRQSSGGSNAKNELSNCQKTENNSRETIVESSDERQEAAVKSSNDRLRENDRKSNGNEWKAQAISSSSTHVESPKTPLNRKYDISDAPFNAEREKVIFRTHFPVRKAFTHFLSIPLNTEIVMTNYMNFKEALLNEADKHPGVRRELFRRAEKLHIPIGMLCINGEEAETAAIKVLQDCKEKIIMPAIQQAGPIKITLEGVSNPIANEGVGNLTTLYSNVATNNNIHIKLLKDIVDFFTTCGFRCKPADTYYPTLMWGSFGGKNRNMCFFGKNIISEYKNYHFGEVQLTTIHLSHRERDRKSGYYRALATIDIP